MQSVCVVKTRPKQYFITSIAYSTPMVMLFKFLCSLMQSKPVGRVEHKAADQMYVDFAGDRLSITDPISGQSTPVDVFVAILRCSHYTFCKAVASQRKE